MSQRLGDQTSFSLLHPMPPHCPHSGDCALTKAGVRATRAAKEARGESEYFIETVSSYSGELGISQRCESRICRPWKNCMGSADRPTNDLHDRIRGSFDVRPGLLEHGIRQPEVNPRTATKETPSRQACRVLDHFVTILSMPSP